MSNPSTAIGEHGQLSGRFPDACQLQVGIAITKAALKEESASALQA